MLRFVFFIALFLVFTVIRIAWKVARKTLSTGKIAYDSIINSRSFDEAYRNFASGIRNDNRLGGSTITLLEEVIALMAKVAASDGKVSRAEIEYMSDTIISIANTMLAAGVSSSVVEQMKKQLFTVANEAKSDAKPLYYYTAVLSNAELEMRKRAMLQILGFATIDGPSEAKMELLYKIGVSLNFTKEVVEGLISEVFGRPEEQGTSSKNPYEVLGCKATDSFETIKLAYRRLVKKYHPDYMHGLGVNDQAVKNATRKLQEINAAYEEIKKMRA